MDRPSNITQILIVICVVVWIACAVNPWDFEAWLLEQFATLCALIVLAWCAWRNITFSTSSKISIAIILIAHTIGTHFTYSDTPYDEFLELFAGFSLNDLFAWERNHYDRFVHLLYGMCLAMPTAAVLGQRLQTGVFTSRFLAFHIIISTSALYELVEWSAALLFGGDLGNLYLGTQGDIWDAQTDIALAGIGQLGVYAVVSTVDRVYPWHKQK
jgi:putative membrane protein